MSGLFIKKDLSQLIADADAGASLKRSLGPLNLTMLGIGAIVGAGIFTLTGAAAASYAGPGIVYSFVLGGILCALAGLCYAEMAAMIPVAGSAYTYSYATMGEFVAWIIGWDLVLEYAFGAVTVAIGWSGYLISLVQRTLGIALPDTLLRLTRGPWETVIGTGGQPLAGLWNLPATFIALVMAWVLHRGIRESARLNNVIVAIKLTIVVLFILAGLGVVSAGNLQVNPGATGLASLVPARESFLEGGHWAHRYGWLRGGVLTGAGVVFFAYIGFDAVSTTAQEARNPRRDMPIGILASLVACTVLYILVAVTLTGVVSYRQLGVADPIALGIDRIVQLHQWSPLTQRLLAAMVKVGALAGLTSVILVIMMAQTRIFFAMARDGLLPWFGRVHPRRRTPHLATAVTAGIVATGAGLMPIGVVGKLVSIGTLLAFLLVCVGVPILRWTSPGIPRPFRVPWAWLVGPAGAAACLWVMASLDLGTWLRLLLWLGLGLVLYFLYGRRHSHLQEERGVRHGPLATDLLGLGFCLVALGGLAWFLTGLGGAAGPVPLALLGLGSGGQLTGVVLCLGLAGYGLRRVLGNRLS